MSVLICKFASRNSRPEKIQAWITYLGDLQRAPDVQPVQQEVLSSLSCEAQQWLSTRSASKVAASP